MTVILWYVEFKGQYLVHIDLFIDKVIEFTEKYYTVLDFLDKTAIPYLRQLCDPEKKYFVTVHNCNELMLKLRSPEVISKLWALNHEKVTIEPFVSDTTMVVRLATPDNANEKIIGITGQKIIFDQGEEKQVKNPPAILVGSSAES